MKFNIQWRSRGQSSATKCWVMSSGTRLPRVTRARYLNISKELKLQGSSFFTFRPPPRCLGSWKEIHLYPSPASRSARDPEAVCTGSLLRSCKTSGAQGCGGPATTAGTSGCAMGMVAPSSYFRAPLLSWKEALSPKSTTLLPDWAEPAPSAQKQLPANLPVLPI